MELKVWVEGIQRIVCGVNDKTTCQDIVIALAHATGKTGRFSLVEKCRNTERPLPPSENPLRVLSKWGHYASDVQFILRRSGDSPATSRPSSGKRKTQEKQSPDFSLESSRKNFPVKKSMTFSGGVNSLVFKGQEFQEKVIKNPETTYEDLVKLTSLQRDKLKLQDNDMEQLDLELKSLENFANLDTTLEEIEEEEETLEKKFRTNESELSEMEFWEDELNVEKGNEEKLKKELELAENKVKETESKLVQYENQIKELAEDVLAAEKEQKEAKEKADSEMEEKEKKSQDELAQLRKELELQNNIDELNNKCIEELEEKISKLEEMMKAKTEKFETLDTELKEVNLQDFEDVPSISQSLVVKHGRCSTPIQDLLSGAFTLPRHGSGRCFQGNPRILETAEPSSENPEGIWV
ncbi:ras association domain-containing protein 8-like [Ptychodera flava]|uniref:ras association domain-containing protein 8-like n=1 Tax=Ptychodera flava TaxID=63121 RepID=UPI003969CB9B